MILLCTCGARGPIYRILCAFSMVIGASLRSKFFNVVIVIWIWWQEGWVAGIENTVGLVVIGENE